jgi:hypothetical protein
MRSRPLRRRLRYALLLLTLLTLSFTLITAARAAPGGAYTIDWYSFTSGATAESAAGDGALTLTGAAGQPESVQLLRGGNYTLEGGFVARDQAPPDHDIFLPLALRSG